MANMAARTINRTPTQAEYQFYGGFATIRDFKDKNEDMYTSGPSWFTDGMSNVY